VTQLYGNFIYASIPGQPLLVTELLNRVLLVMVGAQHATLCHFGLDSFKAEGAMHHRANVVALLARVQVIED
jgi:hypothetical protein